MFLICSYFYLIKLSTLTSNVLVTSRKVSSGRLLFSPDSILIIVLLATSDNLSNFLAKGLFHFAILLYRLLGFYSLTHYWYSSNTRMEYVIYFTYYDVTSKIIKIKIFSPPLKKNRTKLEKQTCKKGKGSGDVDNRNHF